jgi:hypothetical protein
LKSLAFKISFELLFSKALIFHSIITCDNIFQWVPEVLINLILTLVFDLILKTLTLAISFEALIFHMSIPLRGYQHFLPGDFDVDVFTGFENFNLKSWQHKMDYIIDSSKFYLQLHIYIYNACTYFILIFILVYDIVMIK